MRTSRHAGTLQHLQFHGSEIEAHADESARVHPPDASAVCRDAMVISNEYLSQKSPPELLSLVWDGVHPTDQGYATMADVWYTAIKDVLPN